MNGWMDELENHHINIHFAGKIQIFEIVDRLGVHTSQILNISCKVTIHRRSSIGSATIAFIVQWWRKLWLHYLGKRIYQRRYEHHWCWSSYEYTGFVDCSSKFPRWDCNAIAERISCTPPISSSPPYTDSTQRLYVCNRSAFLLQSDCFPCNTYPYWDTHHALPCTRQECTSSFPFLLAFPAEHAPSGSSSPSPFSAPSCTHTVLDRYWDI